MLLPLSIKLERLKQLVDVSYDWKKGNITHLQEDFENSRVNRVYDVHGELPLQAHRWYLAGKNG